MLRILLSVGLVPAVMSIIVTDPPPTSTEYNYSYNIVGPRTGEVSSGGLGPGSYSAFGPDGTHRAVHYPAHPRREFEAVVHSEPLAAPYHHVVRDSDYTSSGNARYLNQYYSSDPIYRGYSLRQPLATRPSANYNIQTINDEVDNRQTRYFTPSDEIRNESKTSFKSGELFAPSR